MSFIFSSVKFYDEFTELGGGGVNYLNGGVINKYFAIIEGYFYLAYKDKFLRFSNADSTITNIDETDLSSFKDDGDNVGKGLAVGRVIAIENTDDNDGTYTITEISEDGRTITVAESLTDEDYDGADIYDDTIIDALDFYYNLIPNGAEESYMSLTDKGTIQKFTVDGLYDSDTPVPVNMLVASSSLGWVTNGVDENTGETTEVTAYLIDVSDHKQTYSIYQELRISPFATADQLKNFVDQFAPSYFAGGERDINALKYICRVDGKFQFTDPDIPHTGSYTSVNGLTNWFNQNNIRSRPEYYFDSIIYINSDAELVDTLDVSDVTTVYLFIKSRNAKFHVDNNTKYALDFCYLPLNDSRYTNTPERTLLQNFLNDRIFQEVTETGNGENFGTDYQVMGGVFGGVLVGNDTLQITFQVLFSEATQALLKGLDESNRKFFFAVTTQDYSISSTTQTDRVSVLTPVNKIGWVKSNPDLLLAVDNIRTYMFPSVGECEGYTSISGYEGDPFYVEFPFTTRLTPYGSGCTTPSPTIKRAGFQIVVTKEGEEDFVLEETVFDTSLVRKLDTIQTIDIEETKNYIGMPDEYNTTWFRRDSSFDAHLRNGYNFHYASVLRYDYWNELVQESERFKYCLFSSIENPTQAWHTLQENGWALQIRFFAEVAGYNHQYPEQYADNVETFDHYWDIDVKAPGDASDVGTTFTVSTRFEDYETGITTQGVTPNGKTLITFVAEGDFSSMPDRYNSIYAQIFADYVGGGVTNRRFASTEFDSEEESPFSAPDFREPMIDLDVVDHSWASKNMRISVRDFDKVVIQTIYDDTKQKWSNITESLFIIPRIGFMCGCFILNELGGYVLDELGQRGKMESCEEAESES